MSLGIFTENFQARLENGMTLEFSSARFVLSLLTLEIIELSRLYKYLIYGALFCPSFSYGY